MRARLGILVGGCEATIHDDGAFQQYVFSIYSSIFFLGEGGNLWIQ